MNMTPYHADISVENINTKTEQSIQVNSFLPRIERCVAALFIATEHIKDEVSLKNTTRTLATELLVYSPEKNTTEALQSCIRIFAVGNYISEQNAKILIAAIESIRKSFLEKISEKKTLYIKDFEKRIQPFEDVGSDHIDSQKNKTQEEVKDQENKQIHLHLQDSSQDSTFELRKVLKESGVLKDKKEEIPSFLKEGQSQEELVKKDVIRTTSIPPKIQRSEYALQERVPTGFSQNISFSKKEDKNTSRRDRISMVLSEKKDTTIKEILSVFPDISEKTLQRELNDMVEQGLLRRIGERRWSRYELVRFGV
jgi:hypothetical protein